MTAPDARGTRDRATDAPPDGRPAVLVVMLTYRRPDRLERAVSAVAAQCAALVDARAELLVVDNDPDGSAREAVTRHGCGVRYLHEPRPGIAAARNAALAAATADGAAAVVFIDDDELPAPGWLPALVGSWRAWGCAAVAGPARRIFDGPVPDWVVASGFFVRTDRPSGSRVAGAATNNLLLDLAVLRGEGLTFDDRFGLTGGSDTLITRALTRRGHEIRWCDEAEVLDPIPADRATREWVLRRCFRTGTTWSRVHVILRDSTPGGPASKRVRVVAERVELTVRALARIGSGVCGTLARRRGRRSARAQCRIASGAGMLAGAWGLAYQEYRRTPR